MRWIELSMGTYAILLIRDVKAQGLTCYHSLVGNPPVRDDDLPGEISEHPKSSAIPLSDPARLFAGPLTMNNEEFRKAGYQAIDQSTLCPCRNCTLLIRGILVIEYFNTIGERPVLPSVQPGFMREALPSSIPVDGVKWDQIQPDIENLIMVLLYFI
jgi:hypothetical protein